MRAVDGLIEVLRDERIDRVFGNPGTTELPFVDALDAADLGYVLAPHEGAVVSMADGFARATRRTSFVSLHVAAGLANGLIGLLNAARSRTPMVVTAGQQDRRHLAQEPMLSGDLVGLATAASKAAVEVHRAEDLALVMRRAFRLAAAPPAGPVFVSIPMDLLGDPIDAVPARTAVDRGQVAAGVGRAAELLRRAERAAVIAGDGVGRRGGMADLVRIAESLGAVVYHQPMNDRVDFPMDHPQYAGMLLPENEAIRKALDGHDVVFLAGVRAFAPHHYTAGEAIGPDVRVVQLDDVDADIGRNYPVTASLLGDIAATLGALADALGPPDGPARKRTADVRLAVAADRGDERRSRPVASGDALDPRDAAAVVAESLPPRAIVVEEAITTGLLLRRALRLRDPDSFHHAVGGGLGWGVGASVGVALGRPDRPVVAALGDGCALFGVQGLWAAARLETATTFVVFVNDEYRTLKQTMTTLRGGRTGGYPGMDLAPPRVNWTQLSGSLGVPGVRVTSESDVAAVLSERTVQDGPLLVEIPVRGFAR